MVPSCQYQQVNNKRFVERNTCKKFNLQQMCLRMCAHHNTGVLAQHLNRSVQPGFTTFRGALGIARVNPSLSTRKASSKLHKTRLSATLLYLQSPVNIWCTRGIRWTPSPRGRECRRSFCAMFAISRYPLQEVARVAPVSAGVCLTRFKGSLTTASKQQRKVSGVAFYGDYDDNRKKAFAYKFVALKV